MSFRGAILQAVESVFSEWFGVKHGLYETFAWWFHAFTGFVVCVDVTFLLFEIFLYYVDECGG